MKKTLLLIIAICAIHFVSVAQQLSKDFTVTNSTPYDVIDAGSKEYLALGDGTAIYAKMRGGIVTIQKFDGNQMKEVSRKVYEDMPDKAYFQDLIKVKNKIYYIFEAYDKKGGNFKLYYREINPADATFGPSTVMLTTSTKVTPPQSIGDLRRYQGGVGFIPALNKFKIVTSFDESKILATYRCAPKEKDDAKNNDKIGFYVFDAAMKSVWGQEVTMPYTEKNMNNVSTAVGSNGEVKFIITNNVKKTYEVLNINTKGVITVIELGISAKQLVRNLDIKENQTGGFVCGGWYANGIEVTFNPFNGAQAIFNANGLMFIQLDKTGKLVKHQNFEFSKEFIQQNLSQNQKEAVAAREKEGKAGIFDLFMTNFIVKPDGSAFFVGESMYTRNEFWGPSQTLVYHFSNVVVIKVDATGKLSWMKKLPKNQAGVQGCGQMGIAYLEGLNADYVAFVDNPKNIALSANGGVPAAHKDGAGGFLTTYKIDHATGALEKHTICELTNINGTEAFQFKTIRVFKSKEDTFLFEVYIKGKKDMTVKIQLKK